MGNQWTRYTKHILALISDNSENNNMNQNTLDYPSAYPFRLGDGNNIPTDNTGYVYCLVSVRNKDRIYIGQTECLAQRLIQHNSGAGSRSTEDIQYRPWAVGSYICGLSHLNRIERMSLERQWKIFVQNLRLRGRDDSFSWINAGEHVIDTYNNQNIDHHIRFVRCVSIDMVTNS